MAFSLALGVNTDSLKAQSDRVLQDVEDIANSLRDLHMAMESTRGYWKGEGGDLYRRHDEAFGAEATALLERLRRYPTDIQQMAGVYEGAEESNVSTSSQLGTSIVLS